MILLEELKKRGWYFTEEGLRKLTTINNLQTQDVDKIISLALNWDLKDIASSALPSKIDSNGTVPGRIVLQIQKMRNISAPKANEESTAAPRFLHLELCDGVNTIAALEFERIENLNLNVPPGTKLLIKSEKVKIINGFLVLKAADVKILGGKVEALVERWELARQMLKYARSNRRLSGSGGPPPWIAFGKHLEVHTDALLADKNFKSLQTVNEKDKNSKENEEFNATRSQAIAEAAKTGQKKIFGGGQQNILDHNVKKILDKGYSEEEAKQALKTTNNNLERALYNLKRRNANRSSLLENMKPSSVTTSRLRDKGTVLPSKEETVAAKPQANVSLFDFLTDKLPVPVSSSNTVTLSSKMKNERNFRDTNSEKVYNIKVSSTGYNKFENNMSSSFAANRATTSTKFEDKPTTQSRSTNINRKQDENQKQTDNKNEKVEEKNHSNRIKTHTHNNNKIQNQIPPTLEDNESLTESNTKRNERSFKKDREHTQRHTTNDYYVNRRLNDSNKMNEKKSYQARDGNRNQNSRSTANSYQQKQTPKSNNLEKALDKLSESASKLDIQNKKDLSSNIQQNRGRNNQRTSGISNHKSAGQIQKLDHYSNNSQLHSQSGSAKSLPKNASVEVHTSQIGDAFAYDASKIVGFQSKEANDYAMNMLKSQGLPIQHLQIPQSGTPQAQQITQLPSHPPQQKHSKAQITNNTSSVAVAYMAHNPNVFVAAPQQSTSQFAMMAGENWPWKNGDLCFAKYWDDGNYYKAKITAISDKTCVVLFLGYGNHEEVLKSDCVPTTDTQHIPINAYQGTITAAVPVSVSPSIQQRSNLHTGISSVGNHRYRGERQMYVPPPKRINN